MIVTCTLNPSLDYFMESDSPIQAGGENRSMLEYYEAGGKGINVSIVLNNLQVPSNATGFLGGFTKDFYITLLEKYSFIQPNFIYTGGHTRINIKYRDSQAETELNATGPYITKEDMEKLMMKTNRLDEGDYFVFAGYCPEHLNDEICIMLERLMDDGVRVVLNTSPEILRQVLKFHPFLVKTSTARMEEYFGRTISKEAMYETMKRLREEGAVNVLSTSTDGTIAYLSCADGEYESSIHHPEKVVSMIGTGDALVAGFIMTSLRSKDPVEAFRFGCCCGEATAFTKGFGTRERIMELYEDYSVSKAG